MLRDLLELRVISPICRNVPVHPTMTVSIRPKPGGKKSLVILDMRRLIQSLRFAPRRFKLPRLESLYAKVGKVFFIKVDVQNAYHSVVMPSEWTNLFVFTSAFPVNGFSAFKWNRLGFGWDKAPWVFQQIMAIILDSVDWLALGVDIESISFAYLDDVLFACSDPLVLGVVGKLFVQALVANGFLPSWKKCILEPTSHIDWLGKSISSSTDGVSICCPQDFVNTCTVAAAAAASKSYPARLARQVAGMVAFATMHQRLALPWLQHTHLVSVLNARCMTETAIRHLATACHLASLPASSFPFCRPIKPGPFLNRPVVFIDGASALNRIGLIIYYLPPYPCGHGL